MDNPPTINYITREDNPERYKDIFIKFLIAVIEANKSKTTQTKTGGITHEGSIDQKITAYKDFIRVAQAVISKSYKRTRVEELEPNYIEMEKEYFRRYPPLTPEFKVFERVKITHTWKERYLSKLQTEFGEVIELVYKETGWNFDTTKTMTHGK